MLSLSPDDFELHKAFAKIVCEPSWKWQRRVKPLENYDLFYVWSGEGVVTLNERPYPVRKGSCFLFRPGDYTSASHNPQKPLTLTYIHFQLNKKPDHLPEPYRILDEPLDMEKLLTSYVRLALNESFGAEEEARLVLMQMMIRLLREDRQGKSSLPDTSDHTAEVIHEVANYIRLHPGKHHRLEELAARAQLSTRYFSLKFKTMIGEPVQTYLIRSRIERAEHLLKYAGMTVTEVADALGYRDVFFFSRQFKKHTGKSPSEIR